MELAGERRFDVALCDVQLPGLDGIELLDRLVKASPETAVFLITAYATVENAVEAFHRGAQDYLMKPILLDEVSGKIRRLLKLRELTRENRWLRRELNRAEEQEAVVGHSPAAKPWDSRMQPCEAGCPGRAPRCIATPDQVMRCMKNMGALP